jgi:hypothetical protein
MTWPHLFGRVAVRIGVGLWRQRLGLILAAFIMGAFGAYQFAFAGPSVTNGGAGGGGGVSGDCADTAMAALTHVNDATAHAAYACLGPAMRTTTEDQFVATMKERALPAAQASRVADRSMPDGGKIVFFTISATNLPPVGYIVYLGLDGKVVKVE